MPMTTMLVMVPKVRAAIYSATISSEVRERTTPREPLAQKAQPMAQPTCVERHCVKRSVAGMRTVSTLLPSAKPMRSFFVPSEDVETCRIW